MCGVISYDMVAHIKMVVNRECTVKKESARWRSQYGLPETELPMQQHGSRKVPRINLLIIKV